jgi:hypothetical protein
MVSPIPSDRNPRTKANARDRSALEASCNGILGPFRHSVAAFLSAGRMRTSRGARNVNLGLSRYQAAGESPASQPDGS